MSTGNDASEKNALRSFNVKDFGAAGNNQNDDTSAIQAAVQAAIKEKGGRIHFPSGHYRLTHAIQVTSADRIDITGDGFSTVLHYRADEPAVLWNETSSCRESSIRDLCLTASGANKSPSTPAIALHGGSERSLFSNLLLNSDSARMGSGIEVLKVMDTTTLDNCQFWGVSGTGIKVAQGSEVRIIGGRVIGRDRYSDKSIGIHLTGNNGGVHVVTTDIIALETAMKIGEAGGPSNREIFITHATFDSSIHGLVQIDHSYTSIAGCWAASSDEEQILVDSTATGAIVSISGGTIFNGGAYGKPGGHHGLVVRAGSFMLNGVTVRHNQGTGILVEGAGVKDYAITGCRIADNGTGAVLKGNCYTFTGNVLTRNTSNLIDKGGPVKSLTGNVLHPPSASGAVHIE